MTDDTRKHLDYLQNIITRMNTNSFQLKGLAITLLSAFAAIFAANQKIIFLLIPILPTLLFWFLDSYYLQMERKFRGIYNDVAGITKEKKIKLYAMPYKEYKGNGYSYIECFLNITIFPLYFVMLIAISVFSYVLYNNGVKFF
jgi:hypothetical protein